MRSVPAGLVFQLTSEENEALNSKLASQTLASGRRYLPYAFTEHGAVMAASVLNSPKAAEMSVESSAPSSGSGIPGLPHQLAAKLTSWNATSQPTTAKSCPVRGSPQPDGDAAKRLRYRFRFQGKKPARR